jgi:hypothetical protein
MADQQEVRDKRGWFQPGTAAGPGRPKRTDYAKIIRDALTPTAAFQIVEMAIEHAKGGDRHARAWVFSHVVAPVPKTLVLDDTAIADRSTIDQAVGKLSVEQLATLQAVLSAMKEPS